MTTHLRVTRPTAPGFNASIPVYKAACSGWRSRVSKETTEDQAQVDCLRCSKIGGFTPKAKKGSDNPGGTCQVCFAVQRVVHGTEALHGYNRPGVGYIFGQCPGSQHLPFEKDCTLTKTHRANLQGIFAGKKAYLAQLEAGKVTSLTVDVETTERNADYRPGYPGHRYVHKTFTIQKGQERQYSVEGVRFGGLPSFEELLKREIWEVESTIKHLDHDIKFLAEKLAGWAVKELLP